jgi:ABC-type Fe3+-hydroxamate transport system substrate-binding protein
MTLFLRLADLLGAREAGTSLAENLQRSLADTRQRVAPFPPRRVLFVVWAQPLISVGKDTFIADALQHAGAQSIVDSSQSWPQLNLEEVARQQPDFLVFAESHGETGTLNTGTFSSLPGWRILEAVRNRRYAVTSDAVNRPAPRIVSAIADLARQLHPEAFPEKSENEKNKAENQTPVSHDGAPLFSPAVIASQTLSSPRGYACAR